MGATQLRGTDVLDGSIQRKDLNVLTAGEAVIRKIIEVASSGVKVTNDSTGIDAGTGDVKLAVDFAVAQAKLSGIGLVRMAGTTVGYDTTAYYHSGNLPAHPTYTATSKTDVEGQIISAFSSNTLGHVTGLTSRLLVVGDIPISAWAKAAVKPAYLYSEISGLPALNYLPLVGGILTGPFITDFSTNSGYWQAKTAGILKFLIGSYYHLTGNSVDDVDLGLYSYQGNIHLYAAGIKRLTVNAAGIDIIGSGTFSGSVTASGLIVNEVNNTLFRGIDIQANGEILSAVKFLPTTGELRISVGKPTFAAFQTFYTDEVEVN